MVVVAVDGRGDGVGVGFCQAGRLHVHLEIEKREKDLPNIQVHF